MEADQPLAFRMHSDLCGEGFLRSCHAQGVMLVRGWGTDVNLEQGYMLFQRACKGDVAEGCRNVGILSDSFPYLATNPDTSAKALRKGCDLGDKMSCDLFEQL